MNQTSINQKFESVRNLTLGAVEQERRVCDLKNWIFRDYAGLHGFAYLNKLGD